MGCVWMGSGEARDQGARRCESRMEAPSLVTAAKRCGRMPTVYWLGLQLDGGIQI